MSADDAREMVHDAGPGLPVTPGAMYPCRGERSMSNRGMQAPANNDSETPVLAGSEAEMRALAAQARELELALFDQDRAIDPRSHSYRILPGRIPIALSAPHAVRQRRAGADGDPALHRSEPYTGPLAIQLHWATGAWAIYATRTARRDPNHAPDAPYKCSGLVALARRAAPRLLLDLHGAHRVRDFAVAIGTSPQLRAGRAQAAVELLADHLSSALDSAVVVDPPEFRADGAGTVAAYCWSVLGIPAVQLEIGRAYRSALQNPLAYAALFAALRDAIVELAAMIPRYSDARDAAR